MFKKILVANRGEIACRILRTARAMGIKTVAVHSSADRDALHVRMADEAVHIGPSPAAESYLDGARILAACKETGADAVHPGYGFLSENAEFAELLGRAGIAFIGPGPRAIRAMGDKIESKKLAQAAGVNTVPGHLGVLMDAEDAVAAAGQIGYPVMLKASAGGGGKGMRIAQNDAEVRQGFRAATNEALSSFADGRIFIEKFVTEPRHIEIQILADGHGNCLYLGERECSIQRRHQKVIEEAPSSFLDEKTRRAMGAQAVALANAVGYKSAGTVEFIVDAGRNFYFLEMNTRLQVEHPVTEMVTGLDLVEQMIRIAAGEALNMRQSDIVLRGWAIEARLYAEDPFRDFLPSTGRLLRYHEPAGEGVRIDSGVSEGAEIGMFYDPMIAKLIVHAKDRPSAIAAMRKALDAFYVRGPGHNLPFLSAVLAHPRFAAGRLSTAFIAEEFPDGFKGAPLDTEMQDDLASVAAFIHDRHEQRARGRAPHFKTAVNGGNGRWAVIAPGIQHILTVTPKGAGYHLKDEMASRYLESDWQLGDCLWRGAIDGRDTVIQVDRSGASYRLTCGGAQVVFKVMTPRAAALAVHMPEKTQPDLSKYLLSPMPGLLVSLAVAEGEEVEAGQELAVVEAMKMENLLRAPRDGRVAKLQARPGDSLAVDQIIIEFA